MGRISLKYLLTSLVMLATLLVGGCAIPPLEVAPPPSLPSGTASSPTATAIDPGFALPPISVNAPLLPDVAEVVARVKPSVVAINTTIPGYNVFIGSYTEQAAGSGWIIDDGGLIVTNNHVVEGAQTISVTLDDGRTFSAETVRTDSLTDLAVLKISAGNLAVATVGDSSRLRIGDWVTAIGNSLGMGISATAGIVSTMNSSISVSAGQTLYDLIQTDAAINPGNSGGPLVNMAGEVVGITSAKITQVGVEGMGYAISINGALPVIEDLVKTGYVVRPFLGVEGLLTVDSSVASYFRLNVSSGVLVRGVAPNTPAASAGLAAGDVIASFAGQEVSTVEELRRAINLSQIGQEVEITYWRAGKRETTRATLAETPPPS